MDSEISVSIASIAGSTFSQKIKTYLPLKIETAHSIIVPNVNDAYVVTGGVQPFQVTASNAEVSEGKYSAKRPGTVTLKAKDRISNESSVEIRVNPAFTAELDNCSKSFRSFTEKEEKLTREEFCQVGSQVKSCSDSSL